MRKRRTGNMIGYARVSTKDQSTKQQVAALVAHGVPEDNIFVEVISGASDGKIKSQRQHEMARSSL